MCVNSGKYEENFSGKTKKELCGRKYSKEKEISEGKLNKTATIIYWKFLKITIKKFQKRKWKSLKEKLSWKKSWLECHGYYKTPDKPRITKITENVFFFFKSWTQKSIWNMGSLKNIFKTKNKFWQLMNWISRFFSRHCRILLINKS